MDVALDGGEVISGSKTVEWLLRPERAGQTGDWIEIVRVLVEAGASRRCSSEMRWEWGDGCGMRMFDPLRTAEEELRTSTHCRLRKRRWGFRLTADCGGGNGDFDAMRSTEEKFLRLERW